MHFLLVLASIHLNIYTLSLIEHNQVLEPRRYLDFLDGSHLMIKMNQTESKKQKSSSFKSQVDAIILANLTVIGFRNTALAKELRISPSQLFRKIKAFSDQSVAIYIRSIRLKEAMKLLIDTELNVSEIAYRTGFNDPSYFTRTFIKQYGITPSDLRYPSCLKKMQA